MSADRRLGCDHDVLLEDLPRKQNPGQLLMMSAVKQPIVRRSHVMYADGTHVIDQGAVMRTISASGQNRAIERPNSDLLPIDLCAAKGADHNECWVLRPTVATMYVVASDGTAAERIEVRMPRGKNAIKAEVRAPDADHQLLVLFEDGELQGIDLSSVPQGGETKEFVTWSDSAELLTAPVTGVADFSLSSEGKIVAVLQHSGVVSTLKGGDLSKICNFTPSNEGITAVRVVPGVVKDNVAHSHVVITFAHNAKEAQITTYHVKNVEDVWQPWRVQGVTIPASSKNPFASILEVSSAGDACCVVSRYTMYVLKLSVATENGRLVKGVAQFECGDANYGEFLSIEARSEKEGVRFSSRRSQALVMHDIAFSELSAPRSADKKPETVDELERAIKRLERENQILRTENQALQNRKASDVPGEFEQHLKKTIQSVEETVREMARFQGAVTSRLTQLEDTIKRNEDSHRTLAEDAQKLLKRANDQAVNVIRDAAQKDETELRTLQVTTVGNLKKLQEEVESMLKRTAADSVANRETEMKRLFEGLQEVTQSLLSDPGLLKLRDLVVKAGFPTPITEETKEGLRKAIDESLDQGLKTFLADTAKFLLKTESDALSKNLKVLMTKGDELMRNVGPETAQEVNLGLKKLEEENPLVMQWQEQANKELKRLLEDGRELINRSGNELIDGTVELLGRKRSLKRCLDREEFWSDGVTTIMRAGDSHRESLLRCLVEWSASPPAFPTQNLDTPPLLVSQLAKLLSQKFASDEANNDSRTQYVCAIITQYHMVKNPPQLLPNLRDAMQNLQQVPSLQKHPAFLRLQELLRSQRPQA
eukprot:TRINITY_DN32158_c0_g1_i1.p1 TRINITY_DN32158_c0_g1~~TRINITY_DN32158_c0_g1_i1.p1  ORF type:complete len:846 (+),score=392.80 TRINITY_DN32158_c0_g1_i1:69-2540(+)